jgi:hypothetical protein
VDLIIKTAIDLTDNLIDFFDHNDTDCLPAAICCVFAAVDLYKSEGWTDAEIKNVICQYIDKYSYYTNKVLDFENGS